MKTLVIIPAYNEASNISSIVTEVRDTAPDCDIVVIDDGSNDETAALAERRGALVLSLVFNCGIGAAVQTGFKYAKENNYDAAVQIDGDGQHDPSGIAALLDEMKKSGCDLVIGSRFLSKSSYTSSRARMLGIWIFRKVNSFLLGQTITDSTSGFRAYNKRTVEFLSENYPGDYPEPEAVVLLGLKGYRIKEAPVQMRKRSGGKSSIGVSKSIYYMPKVLLAIFMNTIRAFTERRK